MVCLQQSSNYFFSLTATTDTGPGSFCVTVQQLERNQIALPATTQKTKKMRSLRRLWRNYILKDHPLELDHLTSKENREWENNIPPYVGMPFTHVKHSRICDESRPTVMTLPFAANIDIRDTVKYKEVLKQFNLGPDGGILTSLNLFATKFDEIEIFTWSASGAIITEAFASKLPTVVTYVVDTPRSENPTTFMSNVLYASSILYKTRLPLISAFNKVDVAQHQFALEWMQDLNAFEAVVSSDHSYTSNLAYDLSRVLYEFYNNLRSVGVSAVFGARIEAFFKAVEASAGECMETIGLILIKDVKRSIVWRKSIRGRTWIN